MFHVYMFTTHHHHHTTTTPRSTPRSTPLPPHRKEAYEARQARVNLLAFMQAEEDRRWCHVVDKERVEEAEIMKNVPGWKVGESVYHSKKWMPPGNNWI
jgi:hypothetical protein